MFCQDSSQDAGLPRLRHGGWAACLRYSGVQQLDKNARHDVRWAGARADDRDDPGLHWGDGRVESAALPVTSLHDFPRRKLQCYPARTRTVRRVGAVCTHEGHPHQILVARGRRKQLEAVAHLAPERADMPQVHRAEPTRKELSNQDAARRRSREENPSDDRHHMASVSLPALLKGRDSERSISCPTCCCRVSR